MLTGTWCLMMVIIVHSYTSTLKSYMTVSTLKPSISSFEDLIEHKDFKITVEKNQILTKTILVQTCVAIINSLYHAISTDYSRVRLEELTK